MSHDGGRVKRYKLPVEPLTLETCGLDLAFFRLPGTEAYIEAAVDTLFEHSGGDYYAPVLCEHMPEDLAEFKDWWEGFIDSEYLGVCENAAEIHEDDRGEVNTEIRRWAELLAYPLEMLPYPELHRRLTEALEEYFEAIEQAV